MLESYLGHSLELEAWVWVRLRLVSWRRCFCIFLFVINEEFFDRPYFLTVWTLEYWLIGLGRFLKGVGGSLGLRCGVQHISVPSFLVFIVGLSLNFIYQLSTMEGRIQELPYLLQFSSKINTRLTAKKIPPPPRPTPQLTVFPYPTFTASSPHPFLCLLSTPFTEGGIRVLRSFFFPECFLCLKT